MLFLPISIVKFSPTAEFLTLWLHNASFFPHNTAAAVSTVFAPPISFSGTVFTDSSVLSINFDQQFAMDRESRNRPNEQISLFDHIEFHCPPRLLYKMWNNHAKCWGPGFIIKSLIIYLSLLSLLGY